MGRKVHPYGFRLGVIRDWNARWCAKKGTQYAQLLAEDFDLRKFIRAKVSAAGVSKIGIERFPNQLIVNVFTAKPGIIIGRKGEAVKKLRESLEQKTAYEIASGDWSSDVCSSDLKSSANNWAYCVPFSAYQRAFQSRMTPKRKP